MACQWACSLTCLPYVLTTAVNGCHSIRVFVQTTTANICIDNDSFLSSISVLMMRLLKDSSRPLCFWSLHQSWSSQYFSSSCKSLHTLPQFLPSPSHVRLTKDLPMKNKSGHKLFSANVIHLWSELDNSTASADSVTELKRRLRKLGY